MKIFNKIKSTFSIKSNNVEYKHDLLLYFVFFGIYAVVFIACYLIDKDNTYNTGHILAIILVVFLWQTITLIFRLNEVKINKFDLNIIKGKCSFNCDEIDINYKDLKKILNNINGSLKLYCKSNDNKKHVIRVRVALYPKANKIDKVYYFDMVKYDLDKLLMLLNEQHVLDNSKVTIIGNNIDKNNNSKVIDALLNKYCK